MSWLPRDCHAHSVWSDGELSPAEVVQLAADRGVAPSITDHVSLDVTRSIKSADELARYLNELASLDTARGMELCWHDSLWRELPEHLLCSFTHRIGSLHAIFLGDGSLVHAFHPRVPRGLEPDTYMEALIANAERLAAEMPVDVLAHPTLVPLAWRSRPSEELWTEALEERLVDALFTAGMAFELSTRYPPHVSLVHRALARGVRLSLGSDGHSREQVANIVEPLALARGAGVADEALYDPLVHGSRRGEVAGGARAG